MNRQATFDMPIAEPIRLILSDVDGVMTTGQLWFDASGGEIKQFHVRDGMAIKIWQSSGMGFGIVSSRNSPAVARRAAEIGITHILQGVDPKLPAVVQLLDSMGIAPQQVAYIGDDLPDLPVMRYVGLSVAPADACDDVLAEAIWVLQTGGGCGAIRELVQRLMRATSRWEEHVAPAG
jgi:3-deoxy-D-manno-octulosonate 8-phosphate phosphatase (KDO 8-P phosphatase)